MESLGLERRRGSLLRAIDYWLLVPVFFLCVQGLVVLNVVLQVNFPRSYPNNILVQLIAMLIGLVGMVIVTGVAHSLLKPMGQIIYILSLLLQMLLPIFGDQRLADSTGSNAWLNLPGIGRFQPSELSKIGLCMVLAFVLEATHVGRLKVWQGVLAGLALSAPHLGLIILYQDDLGTALVLIFMLLMMIFVWGIKLRWILLTLSVAVVSLPLIWTQILEPYQQRRIVSFLYPNYDLDASYNVNQAKLAISAGGLTGHRDPPFVTVPVQESDFIFSAVGEYMGFVGCALLIIMACAFLLRCIWIATQTTRLAYRYMATGLTAVFMFHYIENIGMNLGLMPVTGIPLPFVSQGGTAMVMNFLSVGVLMNISANNRMERQVAEADL